MKYILASTLAICYSLTIQQAYAEQNSSQDNPDYDIVYTPNRIAEKKQDTLSNISVISAQEIEQKQFHSVEEALNSLPSISFGRSGSKGTQTSLFFRGTNSDHTVVLVDGVRIVSLATGAARLSSIPINSIERIEVVTGASSSLYGADAIGGVIQIFTKKGQANSIKTEAMLSAGSNNYQQQSVNVSANSKNNRAWIAINAEREKTNGYDVCSSTGSGGCYINEPDDDSYRNQSIGINAGTKFLDDKAQFTLHVLSSGEDTEYDGGSLSGNHTSTQQQTVGTELNYEVNKKLNLKLSYNHSEDKSHNELNKTFHSSYKSTYRASSLIADYQVSANSRVVLGSDFIHEQINSSVSFVKKTRHSNGVFALVKHKINNTELEASYRVDDNSQYHQQESGGFAISQKIGAFKITASHKKAFNAPNFGQLYRGGNNSSLNPEISHTNELNFESKFKNTNSKISLYRTRIKDLITYQNSPPYAPFNTNHSRIKGAEFSTSIDLKNTNFNLSINSLSAKDKGTGDDLLRRPKLKASFGAQHRINKLLLGTQINSQSYSTDFGGVRLNGFTTYDISAEYKIAPQLTIGFKGANITNKQYQTVEFYDQPDRELTAFIRYSGDL